MMVSAQFATMREIGKMRQMTSHRVGTILKELGLRTKDGAPTSEAFRQGLVQQQWYEGQPVYGWFWHVAETGRRLDEAGLANK
jgi:hypothetical protein